MRAVICGSLNRIDALEFGELAGPVPGPGRRHGSLAMNLPLLKNYSVVVHRGAATFP